MLLIEILAAQWIVISQPVTRLSSDDGSEIFPFTISIAERSNAGSWSYINARRPEPFFTSNGIKDAAIEIVKGNISDPQTLTNVGQAFICENPKTDIKIDGVEGSVEVVEGYIGTVTITRMRKKAGKTLISEALVTRNVFNYKGDKKPVGINQAENTEPWEKFMDNISNSNLSSDGYSFTEETDSETVSVEPPTAVNQGESKQTSVDAMRSNSAPLEAMRVPTQKEAVKPVEGIQKANNRVRQTTRVIKNQ